MRFVSFQDKGAASYGILNGKGVVELGRRLSRYPTLRLLLERGGLEEARLAGQRFQPDFDFAELDIAPVVPDASKVLCAGANYHKPSGGAVEKPKYPAWFPKAMDAFVGHGHPIMKPSVSDNLDYEGELAVVIGRAARNVAPADVWSHIAGYTCVNDGTVRDWLKRGPGPGKNFFRSGAVGPYLVTADEMPDVSRIGIKTRVNGFLAQDGNTSQMIFDIPAIISYLSTIIWLRPGDIISTGTPDGSAAAHSPALWLKEGDVVEVDIEGLGVLRNVVKDDHTTARDIVSE